MILKCQASALEELRNLASRDRHSVLVEGASGCGKTYLAKQYAKLLDIQDFVSVASTVNDIRKAIDMCYNLEARVVLCIENLDSGVSGASYTMLKFLEEPRENIYIVVTCCNINKVPDTIVSRSSVVTVASPTPEDLRLFASTYPPERQKAIMSRESLWKAVKSLLDVDYCMNLASASYYEHLDNLVDFTKSKKPVSDIVWSLGHYPDNTELPTKFAIKYIVSNTPESRIQKYGIDCIRDLDSSRIASHAVLSKFVMDCKWGE